MAMPLLVASRWSGEGNAINGRQGRLILGQDRGGDAAREPQTVQLLGSALAVQAYGRRKL